MNENNDVTIKIVTENMPIEFKFLLYSFIWTLTTFNIFVYVHVLKNLKEIYSRKDSYLNLEQIGEVNEENAL